MAEEASRVTSFESVVRCRGVRVIGDHAVVTILLRFVSDDDGPGVGHSLANQLHGGSMLLVHFCHTLV